MATTSDDRLPATYRKTTAIVPPGTYFYKEVRRLGSKELNPLSLYPGLPIFHLYKYVRSGAITIEERVDDNEYWQPVQTLGYVIYTVQDENTPVNIADINAPTIFIDGKQKKTVLDFPAFTHKAYGNKIFIATNKFADVFGDNQQKNPYTYKYLRLWVYHPETANFSFVDNTGERRISYFYFDPFLKVGSSTQRGGFISLPKNLNVTIETIEEANSIREELIPLEGISNQFVSIDIVKQSILASTISYAVKALGKSPEAAAKLANSYTETLKKNFGEGGIRGSSENGLSRASVNVTRSTFGGRSGYTAPTISRVASDKPQMVQQYRLPDSVQPITRRFEFQFKPNQISYSGIGSEWTEIPRSGNVPIVDWKSYKLLQVTFQFLVAPDDDGNLDRRLDEKVITHSIDDKIRTLRQMATAPYPVYLLGFDEIMSEQMRFPFDGGRGVEFVIADFSVSSLLRTSEGKINRAQCDITLREIPIESVRLIDFPKIKFGKDVKIDKSTIREDEDGRNNTWSNSWPAKLR